MNNLITTDDIPLMIEYLHDDYSSKNYNMSWIDSISEYYYKNKGLTQKQYESVLRSYNKLIDRG